MDNFKEEFIDKLRHIFTTRRYEAVGSIIGGLVSIAILLFGFFSTLFVIVFTLIGYKVGQLIQSEEGLTGFIDNKLGRCLGRWR